mgnify:CR=1 FL=1
MQPRTSHRTQRGFVLVTSLLVLVVLAGIGVGAFFLTNMNLRIAENTRASAVAFYNAHEGLDVALLALAREYTQRADSSWPTLAELRARIPAGSPYAIVDLVWDAPGADGTVRAGTVTVRGAGPAGSQYETGARFQGELTPIDVPTEQDPVFGVGWVSRAEIRINGNTSFRIPLWAGNDLVGSSTKVLNNTSNFARSGWRPGLPRTPENRAACTIHAHSVVVCDRGTDPPEIPLFDFDAQLAAAYAERSVSLPSMAGCTLNVPAGATPTINASLHTNGTICLGENANVTLTGVATNLYVLGPRSSRVDLRAGSTPPFGEANGRGLKLVVGTIRMGNGNADLSGMNTLFAANDVEIDKVGASALGTDTVQTLIATEGDVKFQSVRGTLYTVVWANGSVCKIGGGGLNFVGAILAIGSDPRPGTLCNDRNLGIYWNGGGGGTFTGIANVDIPDTPPATASQFTASGIRILARRP